MSSIPAELARREERAQGGIIQFAEELEAIRDNRLYPNAGRGNGGGDAWGTYCKERWNLSGGRVDEIIRAVPVLKRWPDGRDSRPSIAKAHMVATLPEAVQDAILTEDPAAIREQDVQAKAKEVRKEAKRIREQEGHEPTDEELVAVARRPVKAKRTKKPKVKGSRFIELLSQGYTFTKEAADYANNNVLSDTENDWAWNRVEKARHQLDRIAEQLYRPTHVRDWDEEFAKLDEALDET